VATLQDAVKRLVDAANAQVAQVEPLKAALADAQAHYDALVEAEAAEDVAQNAERDDLKAKLAAALADAQAAADAINAEADKLSGVAPVVPVEEVPTDVEVELPESQP